MQLEGAERGLVLVGLAVMQVVGVEVRVPRLQVGAGQREEEPGHQEVTVMAVAAAQLVVQVKAQQGQLVMVGQTLLAVVAVELVAATAPLVELQQAEAAVPLSSCCPSAC